jgi:CheY-like chemotaxis protein
VVLDLSMPVMNGLDAARQLLNFLPAIRIILFTSYKSEQLTREAKLAGIREVVSKDCSIGPLWAAIEKVFQDEHIAATSAHDPKKGLAIGQQVGRLTQLRDSRCYTTGETIPESGIYTVIHEQHRLPHQVTLLKAEVFPRCAKCGRLVGFVLDHSAPYVSGNTPSPLPVLVLSELEDVQPNGSSGVKPSE